LTLCKLDVLEPDLLRVAPHQPEQVGVRHDHPPQTTERIRAGLDRVRGVQHLITEQQ
jgi:hypothetical protein